MKARENGGERYFSLLPVLKAFPAAVLTAVFTAVLLTGCGGVTATDASETPTPSETEASAVPTPVPEVLFPDGSIHRITERRLDLSALCHEDVSAAAEALRQMPGLRYVNLGEEDPAPEEGSTGTGEKTPDSNADPGEDPNEDPEPLTPRGLTWEDVRLLQEACPEAELEYRFSLFGKPFSTLDTEMNFHHVTMDDEGAAVREVLPCMKRCTLLDMDFSGVSSERMAEIRDAYPQMKVVWRIWFGSDCSVRTDVERILASNLNHALTDGNTKDLKYCTAVRFLDIGHNTSLTDFSFLTEMPDLEVAILCITGLHDLTPLSNHEKLEYLEINTCAQGLDLSPLGTCPNLEHLCACYLGDIRGWEALENLKKLQRLWFGCNTRLPDGALEELQAALPDTVINTTNPYGSSGDWRYVGRNKHPRYQLLCEQFDYSNYTNVSSSWYNDPMYYREGERRYRPQLWW